MKDLALNNLEIAQ